MQGQAGVMSVPDHASRRPHAAPWGFAFSTPRGLPLFHIPLPREPAMLKRLALLLVAGAAFALAVYAAAEKPAGRAEAAPIPEMKFNEVKEIAPGVFFRYSSITATDPKIPFGGSNHTWVVFKDYVVVIDANFPKEAADVIAAIKKTTKKPIKYVLDTHHHGDHAYGNSVWAKEGAQIIASNADGAAAEDERPEAVGGRRQGPQGHQGERTEAGRHHLRRQVRAQGRHAARRLPRLRPQPHDRRRRAPTCRSTRSSAPATPA